MLLIGLTGSIATGKSTISRLLSSPPHNLPIIDADLIARQVVEPGKPAYNKIVHYFGDSTPDLLLEEDDKLKGRPLNRPALGRRVFGTSEEKKRDRAVLNGIIHPAVRRALYLQILTAYMRGHWAVILDVPLLFESGLDAICDSVLVVAVKDPEVQMRRLRQRDSHLSEEEARDRVLSQGDCRVKARRAEMRKEVFGGRGRGEVLWNDGAREELGVQVDQVMQRLRDRSPGWWTWVCLGCPPVQVMSWVWGYLVNWRSNREWRRVEGEVKAKL